MGKSWSQRVPLAVPALALIIVLLLLAYFGTVSYPTTWGCTRLALSSQLSYVLERALTGRAEERQRYKLQYEVLGRMHIVIDAPGQSLTRLVGEEPIRTYTVAVGKPKTPTPIGYWRIKKKAIWGAGFGARWMGLDIPWGTYGIHGTNKPWSIGTRASGGCVRMFNRDVVGLYDLVVEGTPVTIKGQPFFRFGETRRVIRPTYIGSDVIMLQKILASKGLYDGPIDGKYGRGTRRGVRQFQEQAGLKVTGVVDEATYDALGIVPLEDDPDLRAPE